MDTTMMQTYKCSILYILQCTAVGVIVLYPSNYEYINIFCNKIYLFNATSMIIIINIIGLYLLLKNIQFEINVKLSYKAII